MKTEPDQIVELINRSDQISDDQRLDIFEFLAKHYILIPLKDGFSTNPDESKILKSPINSGWSSSSNSLEPIDRSNFSRHRAGIVCGPQSGILVLDVDHMGKFQGWCREQGLTDPLRPTLTIKTGGEGIRFHYYYKYPMDGNKYGNRSVRGIFDIRGEGGYVICPGSLHPLTKQPYTIFDNLSLAEAPTWLKNYCLYKTVSGPLKTIETKEHQPMTEMITPVIPTNISIDDLPVSNKIKNMINTHFPVGERSEADQSVLVGLLAAGVPQNQIISIFESFPIGEKYRGKGDKRLDYIELGIKNAIEYIDAASSNIPANPFESTEKKAKPQYNYAVFNGLDIIQSPANFSFIIDHFWPEKEPLLLTGYGGAGKSLMSLQLALDLAYYPSPNQFLDYFDITGQHKTLFVQSENTIIGLKRRLNMMMSAYPSNQNIIRDSIFFLGVNNEVRTIGDFLTPHFKDQIKSAVQSSGASILMIDPLISFHSQDENSNDQMRVLLDNIGMFAEDINVTPLIIHHHAKISSGLGPGGGRGASAIGDWSPNTWELDFKKKTGFKLIHNKARNFQKQDDLPLELDKKTLRFNIIKSPASHGSNVQLAVQALTSVCPRD